MAIEESILARIARQGGAKLLDRAVGRALPSAPAEKPGIGGKLAGAALVRIASRSVPGAIVIACGLVAKLLHERRKARKGAPEPEAPDAAPRIEDASE